MIEISCENGKYIFRCDDHGNVTCDRCSEPWVEFEEGGKALISLLHKIEATTFERDAALKELEQLKEDLAFEENHSRKLREHIMLRQNERTAKILESF